MRTTRVRWPTAIRFPRCCRGTRAKRSSTARMRALCCKSRCTTCQIERGAGRVRPAGSSVGRKPSGVPSNRLVPSSASRAARGPLRLLRKLRLAHFGLKSAHSSMSRVRGPYWGEVPSVRSHRARYFMDRPTRSVRAAPGEPVSCGVAAESSLLCRSRLRSVQDWHSDRSSAAARGR
jgi:hypothetical protein